MMNTLWCGLVLLAVSASPVTAHAEPGFDASGECFEAAAAIPVDAGRARALVPDRFTVTDIGGKAILGVFSETCESQVADGPRTHSFFGGAFIQLDAASDPSGCQDYDFFWTNSHNDDWYRAMSSIGWNMGLVPESNFTITATPATAMIESAIPFGEAPFELDMVSTQPLSQPTPVVSVHCVVGTEGLVRATFEHVPFDVSVGAVSIQFGSSPLWEALGVSSGPAAGLVGRFRWTGIIERL